MSEYRCSNCKRTYSHNEYMNLDTVPVEVSDDAPPGDYGVETVCECGSKINSDKWKLKNTIEHEGEEILVSTVALLIGHGPNRNQWYETCIFHPHGSDVVERYTTQEEAESGHEECTEKVRNREFTMKPIGHRFVFK